jgi:hypothetical protein
LIFYRNPERLKLIRQPVTLLLMDDPTAGAPRSAAALFPSPPKMVQHMDGRLGFLRGALD